MSLEYTIQIQSSLAAVWDALTTPEVPQPHYFGSVLRPALSPGAPFRYTDRSGKRTFIEGETVELEPRARWAHTFRFKNKQEVELSRVTWTLAEKDGGVEVRLVHADCPETSKTYKRVGRGWPFILNNTKSLLETGKVPLKARVGNQLMKVLMPLMPK